MNAPECFFLALTAMTLAGCAPSPQAKTAQSVAAARRVSEVLKEQPLSREVTMTLPRGWKRTMPTVLTNGALDARIDIMVGKSTKTVELEMRQFCRMLTVDGWHCQDGRMAEDGSEGSFPFDTARRRGWVAIRHYEDGTAIILKGEWPTQHDQRASEDFASIFRSIDPQ